MTMTNIEMFNRLTFLQSISSKVTGRLAYAVARNIRKIANECQDFIKIKDDIVRKYGIQTEYGNFMIQQNSESYNKFMDELKVYTDIEHDVDIYSVDEKELWESALNADEMLMIEFMVKVEE